jgi:hypothetical protein
MHTHERLHQTKYELSWYCLILYWFWITPQHPSKQKHGT